MEIGVVGVGNMGGAFLDAFLSSGYRGHVHVCDVSASAVARAVDKGAAAASGIAELVGACDVVFLMVKPQYYEEVLTEAASAVAPRTVFVSVAAGKTLDWLSSRLPTGCKVVRAMPNTPAMVGAGMTAVCPNAFVTEEELQNVVTLLSACGRVERVREELFDAVVAVSGSSPAYFFMMLEAMADAAVAEGMPRAQAYTFAAQAMLGSARLMLDTGKHPGELKDMVTSPRGTTIEAVQTLEEAGFRGGVMRAMRRCAEKCREL